MVTTGMVIVTGQITTKCYLDISGIVRETIRRVGYNDPTTGFDHNSCAVLVMLEEQSGDVALGVDRKGAGDQGVCVGYATDEGRSLPDRHPLHARARPFWPTAWPRSSTAVRDGRQAALPLSRRQGAGFGSVPERKTRGLTTVVAVGPPPRGRRSGQAAPGSASALVIKPRARARPDCWTRTPQIMINPVGTFSEGGPRADAGLTGTQASPSTATDRPVGHGGSAFSGKDPTKPDRSGSYGARWAAKNLVAAGLAKRCAVEIAYVIGMRRPAEP